MHCVQHLFIAASAAPVRLLACTGQAAKPSGCCTGASYMRPSQSEGDRFRSMRRSPDTSPAACLFLWKRNRRQRNGRLRTWAPFLLGSNGVGALLATKSYDLRGVANRTILHVAAGHPSLRSGERYFFVIRCRGLYASCRDSGRKVGFQSRLHTPTLPAAFFRYKNRLPDFPDQRTLRFFLRPCGVKKFTPPDGRGTLKKFLEKNRRNRLVRVQRNWQTARPSACVV